MTCPVLSFVVVSLCIMTYTTSRRIDYGDKTKDERKVLVTPLEDPCCDDSNVVDKFTAKVTDVILSSRKLSDLFSVTLSPKEAEETYYRLAFNAVDNVHTCYPRTVSRTVSDAILATFGNLTIQTHAQAHAHSLATYMKSVNFLTCENLNDLCDAYIYYVKQAACNVPHIPDRSIAFLQAATDGFLHFMTSLDLYTAETVGSLADCFANSLYFCLGVPK